MAIVYQNGVAGKICINPECGWKPLSEFHPRRLLGIPVVDGYKSRCKDVLMLKHCVHHFAGIR